jgi:hypothetical protein
MVASPRTRSERSRSPARHVERPKEKRASSPSWLALLAAPPAEPLAVGSKESSLYAKGAHISPILGKSVLSRGSVMSWSICLGEVALGILFSSDALLWLSCFSQLFALFGSFIMIGSVFVR